jgi:hypothetical protein
MGDSQANTKDASICACRTLHRSFPDGPNHGTPAAICDVPIPFETRKCPLLDWVRFFVHMGILRIQAVQVGMPTVRESLRKVARRVSELRLAIVGKQGWG